MKIGVVGTGLMGAPMGLRLLTSGYRVWGYNRTASRLKALELSGVRGCQRPEDLVNAVDAVVVMLTDAVAIREVLLNEAVIPHLSDRTVIQMGTIAPADSMALQEAFETAGAQYLEAPVLGSIPEAKNGKLIVMVGATDEQFERWRPVLSCFGPEPRHIGPVGTAAALKLAMNQLIGSLTTAFSQSLALIQRSGIAVDDFMAVLHNSALYAPTFDKKLKRMIKRDFADPNFPTKHLHKDMGLFMDTAKQLGIDASAAAAVQTLVKQLMERGAEDDDYSSLFGLINPPPADT